MFNLFRKIPKGYVETVDGYLIKESEAKKVEVKYDGWDSNYEEKIYTRNEYHRLEKAPSYDVKDETCGWGTRGLYRKLVRVNEYGTPIDYHTQEEIQKLKDRIKELEDKYEPNYKLPKYFGNLIAEMAAYDYCTKPKNKRGRPKKK